MKRYEGGFTIAELIVSSVVLITLILAMLGLYTTLIGTANVATVKSVALGAATEQLEYVRSLPYDSLAIEGGSINSSGPKLPGTKDVTRNGYGFEIITSIQYVDDAYDGCLSYPTAQSYLCRNGPAASGAPVDPNPQDYKLVDVVVKQKSTGKEVSRLSTQVAARVAETGGSTGAILVTVIDSTGQPVGGATVAIANTTLSPQVNQSVTSDSNGVAIFLDVTPDSGKDYRISASKTGYNSLSTITENGSLVPTYPDVSVLVQQVTSSTLTIDQTSSQSLKISIVDSTGAAVPNAEFSIKGGNKLYTDPDDESYSFNQSVVATDGSGDHIFADLTPGSYFVCFTSDTCSADVLLAATHTAFGDNSTQPIVVPAGTVSETGSGPMQLAKLFTTSNSSYPRIYSISPASVLESDGAIASTEITITGNNLSGAAVTLKQGATTLPTTPVGSDSSTSITRTVDLTNRLGAWEISLQSGGNIILQNGISPGTLGGINVFE
jgi:protocatechuate 3,4-dioxygenase beta subunit